MKTALRPFLLASLAAGLLAAPVAATWSIVVVNKRTGEVCVAVASCLPGTDLSAGVSAIVVGKGGGVSQAIGDGGAYNRAIMFAGLMEGLTPAAILREIRQGDHNGGQYGIVDFRATPVTFTSASSSRAKKGVVGEVGELAYAIQGNTLAGTAVIDQCVAALLAAEGDLGQRVLVAMDKAREYGGDGRCSCSGFSADSCGSPPDDFTHSAWSACLQLARIGDTDGTCNGDDGCANGDYWLDLVVRGSPLVPDPIFRLQQRYDDWHRARGGRPDGLLSGAASVDSLPADGTTERTVTVRLVDLDGEALAHGGAALSVATPDGTPSLTNIGPVTDHGDGSYSFVLRAGTAEGTDRFAIRAEDELVRATLYPFLEVRSDSRRPLHAGYDSISAAAGASVPFVVDEPSKPRGRFWLFGSITSASSRGPHVRRPSGALLPFLPDASPFFPAAPGELDATGRAEVLLEIPPGALAALAGARLEWTGLVLGKGPPLETNTVGFDVRP